MFAVIVTGAPGAGKTRTLLALADALIDAEVAHATGDVDELAWSYPYPASPGAAYTCAPGRPPTETRASTCWWWAR